MKYFLLLAFVSLNAQAVSLDELLAKQNVTVISPVLYNGLPVYATVPGNICSMVGFTRLVSHKTKRVTFKIGDLYAYAANVIGSVSFFHTRAIESESYQDVFDEVSCAR